LSPYVSRDALQEAAFSGVLPDAMLLEICLANPDATKNEQFLDDLQYRIPNPLPEYMISMIIDNWDLETARTLVERNLTFYAANREKYFNYLLLDNKLDTVNFDTLMNHYLSKGELTDKLNMIELNFELGQYSECDDIFDEILLYNYPPDIVSGIELLSDLVDLLTSVRTDGRSIMELDSIEYFELNNIADADLLFASGRARNILCFVYGECEDRSPVIDTSQTMKRSTAFYDNNKDFQKKYIKITPNPANDLVQIEYAIPDSEGFIFGILNSEGTRLFHKEVSVGYGTMYINVKDYTNGIYIYQATCKNGYHETGKLIISH
jgi:hypothetical protein